MKFFDTHCHIHEAEYNLEGVEDRAKQAGVDYLICVGTDVETSREAAEFVKDRPTAWASVGLHPHDAKGEYSVVELEDLLVGERSYFQGTSEAQDMLSNTSENRSSAEIVSRSNKIVAVGECGLDYFYENSPKADQIRILRQQIELAQKFDLPLIFHVRNAFDDFWPIFDSYKNLRGVLHSFTDTQENLNKAIDRGLYIGVNGIATFTKNPDQLEVYKNIPLSKIVLETDAPYLTPNPFRGTVNEPAKVKVVGEFLAKLRGQNLQDIADATTKNAQTLFNLK